LGFIYGWSFLRLFKQVPLLRLVLLSKFAAYLFPFSDKIFLYELGDFKLNAAQNCLDHHYYFIELCEESSREKKL
jgi:hypothetical protein